MQGLVGDGRSETMRGFHRKQRTQRRARPWLSALAFASVSTIITSPQAYAQQNSSSSSSSSSSLCGSDDNIQVGDATGLASLQAAVNCSGGGEVVAVWSSDVTLDSPVLVGSGTFLSILGQDGGDAVARGSYETRLFEVSEGAELTLSKLKVTEGSAKFGGAISSLGTLVLESCSIDENVATTGNGGAIWASGGSLTISGTEFNGNSAVNHGGAVYTSDTKVVIQDSARFESNQAVEAGAVYCGTANCTLSDSFFLNNNASWETQVDYDDIVDFDETDEDENPWAFLYGGGAATFANAEVDITNCVFTNNSAQVAGGALYGGVATDLNISGCTFEGNIALGYGAAIASSSATFGGGTVLRGNYANRNGGGFFLWDDANCTLNDVTCADNEAGANGGCLYGVGTVVISDETVMQGNVAEHGGCIYAYGNIQVPGGTFTGCEASENGGFLFSSDGSVVTVTGGNIVSNVAKRGAAIYCSGPSRELGGGAVTVFGGNITDNVALELGGAFAAWGEPTLVTVKGGTFRNNSGQFYGGFVFLEEGASVSCEGATIIENVAGDQGGGIYARDATWVNSSCDLISNEAPQGAAAYLTHVEHPARFDNFSITDNVASGGSVFYVAESSVILTEVTFESSIALQEDSSNRAVQLDDGSTLFGDGCVFTGWLGDTVVRSANADSGSLVLNSCDFRGNSATMMVVSPHSDAEIRNALVDEITLANAVVENGSAVLVDRALNCSGAGACGDGGECVDSVLGVLCVCIDDDTPCLTDGGTLTLEVTTSPENVTYNPDLVQFELTASAAEDGTTSAIWALTYEADEMELEVVPESGVLLPGTNITITVTGTPVGNDVGGSLASNFSLISVGNASLVTDSSEGVVAQTVEVQSTYYLCQAFQYAVPADGDDSAESVECEQCAVIDDADGVDCDDPGATLASLPIRSGYWRPSNDSLVVQACLHSKACEGATVATSSDDYCSTGYQGPLCAVCKKGYGRGAGYACHSCGGTMTVGLITVGSLFIVLIVGLLVLTVVFLVGGLDAVGNMGRTLSSNFSISRPMAPAVRPTLTGSEDGVFHSGLKRAWIAPTPDVSSEPIRGLRRSHAITGIGSDVPVGSSRASPVSAVSSVTSAIGMRDGLLKIERSDKASKVWTEESRSGRASPDLEHKPASSATAAAPSAAAIGVEGDGSRPGCCGFGDRIKRLWSRVPLDKLKILVVVWQILTVFPSIAAVDFPPVYSRFLSWIDVVNLDLANVFSASCIFPGLNFYQRLLVITLAPIALCGVLVVTYQSAARRAGIGSAGIIAKRAAWSRHMATGLLLTFLVFTSASTVVFKTFGCDPNAVEGKSYLRADYSLSCETTTHIYYKIYAGFMLLVYPIGIPLLYAFILWKNRYLLNPTLAAAARAEQEQKAAEGDQETGSVDQSNADAQGKKYMSPQEEEELERMVKLRKTNPDLVPSMFLWKDFGPNLYYYEVIECGRRILLTGVLIFIDPYSPAQAAAACIFAFGSLLGFELLRPHLDPADAWLYRLGCVVIFLSNFLALLIKVDAAGEGNGEALGTLLVTVNVFLVIAVIFTSWFSTQQQVDDAKDDENTYTMAMDMINVENLARQATSDPSLNSTSLYPRIARTSAASVGPGASSRRVPVGRPRSGEEKSDVDISAADIEELWQRDKSRQHSLR